MEASNNCLWMEDERMIYRGAGWLTLLTPIVMVLLMTWWLMDPNAKSSNLSLMQFLMGAGIGAAINVVLGFVLNRQVHTDGVRHHFFFMPMQWPSLAIVVACAVVALLKQA